jgi:LacI family transcriptional regulator
MSLIGYDDIPQASWVGAQLTTIRQPVDDFARTTVELLMHRITNPEAEPKNAVIEVELVSRRTG